MARLLILIIPLACLAFFARVLPGQAGGVPQSVSQPANDDPSLSPTVITLHYNNVPMLEVLHGFAKQAGADMGLLQPPLQRYTDGKRVTINLDHLDFWPSLHAILDAAKLSAEGGNGQLVLSPTGGSLRIFTKFTCISRGFLFVPQSCHRTQAVDYTHDGQMQSIFEFAFLAAADVKYHVVDMDSTDWLKECKDEKGNSLILPASRLNGSISPVTWPWSFRIGLKETPDIGAQIAILRGELKFKVQAHGADQFPPTQEMIVPFEFRDLPLPPN